MTKVVLANPLTIGLDALARMLKTAVEKYRVRAECLERLDVEGETKSVEKDGLDQLYRVEVVDCEPVDRGILSVDTEVRVIDVREEKGEVVGVQTDSIDSRAASLSEESFDSARSYTQPRSYVKEDALILPCSLKPGRIYGLTKDMKMHLKNMKLIKADDFHVVGLRLQTLGKLGLTEGSWVVINANTEEYPHWVASPTSYTEQTFLVPRGYAQAQMAADVTRKHFVQVFSVENFLPSESQATKRRGSRSAIERRRRVEDIIYLNPYLYFNMTSEYPAILDDFRVVVEVRNL